MAEYKCKYCGEKFGTPLELARHVRMNHKRATKRAKKAAEKVAPAAQITKTIEAIGVLKGLQVSPNLSTEEKKLLGDVAKTFEGLVAK
ncbi:MAG TPA: C2H2-type zinc finger protein [Methanomicrobia archaeon]|nr:C2H2-type zinc finger protein [Methanomicrobia archaeon]